MTTLPREDAAEHYDSYLDFYRRGPYAPCLVEYRLTGTGPVRLFTSSQSAGQYPGVPTPDLKIEMCTRGSETNVIDVGAGRMFFRSRPGLAIIAPPDTAGDYVLDGPTDLLFTSIPATALTLATDDETGPGGACDLGRLHSAPLYDPLVEQLCRRLWAEASEDGPLGSLFADHAVQTLILTLRRLAGKMRRVPGKRRGGLSALSLRRVIDMMHDRLADSLSLAELASEAGLSPVHFTRAFKQATSSSPHHYFLRLRVERARQLLATTDMPIAEIAFECGFCHQGHLTRVFRLVAGTTPAAFRAATRDRCRVPISHPRTRPR